MQIKDDKDIDLYEITMSLVRWRMRELHGLQQYESDVDKWQ